MPPLHLLPGLFCRSLSLLLARDASSHDIHLTSPPAVTHRPLTFCLHPSGIFPPLHSHESAPNKAIHSPTQARTLARAHASPSSLTRSGPQRDPPDPRPTPHLLFCAPLYTITSHPHRLSQARWPRQVHSSYLDASSGTAMPNRSDDHRRRWRHHHRRAVHVTGPVGALNPTTRLVPLTTPKSRHYDEKSDHDAAFDDDKASTNAADPTSAPMGPRSSAQPSQPPLAATSTHASGTYALWRSRDNRKGRHALALTPSTAERHPSLLPKTSPGARLAAAAAGTRRMLTRFPVWDVSYDVATVFTLGSIVWVMNGFFVLLPTVLSPESPVLFAGESTWGGGLTAVVGATIFEVGSVLLMLEAVNENRTDCFGWALREEVRAGLGDARPPVLTPRRDERSCRHHHVERRALLRAGRGGTDDDDPRDYDHDDEEGGTASGKEHVGPPVQQSSSSNSRKWTWWPSWYELRTHYFRDIGFLACLSQMIGATIFWISGITGIPPILDALSLPATNGIYWLPQVSHPMAIPWHSHLSQFPLHHLARARHASLTRRLSLQVVGGTGFIISGSLFMLETQKRWYLPALDVLGWHVGFWNLVGAIGFTLCGALGFASSSDPCEIALTWATFIGSWAFLVSCHLPCLLEPVLLVIPRLSCDVDRSSQPG